ncbi:MAG: PAS-domain containing protein [Rhodocyclales bacterium]|nr:PAS-domain containing protein [Rhodocyclales bacterium]
MAALLVLAAGMLVSVLAAWSLSRHLASEAETHFETSAHNTFAQLEKQLDDFRNLILGLQGLYIASEKVNREEFHRYSENLHLNQRLPGLQALSFQRYVRHKDKAAFIDSVRHDRSLDPNGYPAFAIRPEGDRSDYVVIDFIEPMAANLSAFGFDAGTQPGNADAIRLSRDSGQFQVSEPFRIVQSPTGAPRIVMRAPIYRHGLAAGTVEKRRAALEGFVVLTLDSHAAFGSFFSRLDPEGISFTIEDIGLALPDAGSRRHLPVFHGSTASDDRPLFTKTKVFEFGGRNWEVSYSAYPAWLPGQTGPGIHVLTLFGGLVISLLLSALYLMQVRSKERAYRLAGEMTRGLRASEQHLQAVADLSSDWYWEQDADYRFTSITGKAQESTQLQLAQVKGKTRWEAFPDAFTPEQWLAHRQVLDAHQPFEIEYTVTGSDGALHWVRIKGSARLDANGRFTGYHGIGQDITERRKAEEARDRQTAVLKATLESIVQGISVIDRDLRLIGWNQRFLDLLRLPSSLAHDGAQFEDFIRFNAERGEYGEGDREAQIRSRLELARQFQPHRIKRTRPDGTTIEIIGTPLPGGGFVTTYTDITEQERIAAQVRQERDFRQHLIESIPGIFYLFDMEGHYLLWNHNHEAVTGYSAEEMKSLHPRDLFEGEDRRRIEERIGAVFASGSATAEAMLVSKDGVRRPFYFTGERIVLEDGRPALVGVGIDMTERKRIEEALFKQTVVLQATLEAMDQGISVVDAGLNMTALNRKFCDLLDLPQEMSAAGATFADFARFNALRGEYGPCDVEEKVREMVERARNFQPHCFRRTRPNGRIIEVRGNPMPGGGFVTTYTDVTEQEHAQAALRLSEQRYRNLIELSPDAVFVHRNHVILIANPAAARLWGATSVEQAIGRNLLDFIHPDSRDLVKERIARLESDPTLFRLPWAEQEYQRADGTRVPVEGSATVIELEDGPAILSVIRDISARKAAENAIRELNVTLEQRVRERTAELEASNQELESFSYSVSHDLRAPLRALNGFSHLLVEEYSHKLDDNGLHYLARIRAASQRMGELIDNLLDLARVSRQELKRIRVDLSVIANDIRESLEEQAPGRKVAWNITPDLMVRADPVLAKALLENLLRNAWKFTAEREEAVIELTAAREGSENIYCVRDNGAGFEMAYADKLFKPFQRLHDAKRFEGTGIGLAIVHRVLRRHGGRIWAEGVPGQGAAFHFTLP